MPLGALSAPKSLWEAEKAGGEASRAAQPRLWGWAMGEVGEGTGARPNAEGKSFQFPRPGLPRPRALIKPLHSAWGRGAAGGSLDQAGEAAAGGSRLGEGQPSV